MRGGKEEKEEVDDDNWKDQQSKQQLQEIGNKISS